MLNVLGTDPRTYEVLITPGLSPEAGGHAMPSYLIWKFLLGGGREIMLVFLELWIGGKEASLSSPHWPYTQEMLVCLIVCLCQIINPEIERRAIHSSLSPLCLSL